MKPAPKANPGITAIEKNVESTGDTPPPPAMTPEAGDDGADLAAARNGDHAAFARLYDRFAPIVLSLCRKHARAEAEDATQETFIRAHRLLHKVEHADKLRPWLFGIARRVCWEHSRAGRRRARHQENAALTCAASESVEARSGTVPTAAEPSAQVEHAEQLKCLEAALDKLDDRERLAIHLYYLEADPVLAAASALKLSRSGYYKLLGRAREHLVELMP